eukprot:8143586-Heterocapsa_arctica.AAC.1
MGLRAHGQPKRGENTTKTTTPGAGGPWAPPEAAPLQFLHRVFASLWPAVCRGPLWRVAAPPY